MSDSEKRTGFEPSFRYHVKMNQPSLVDFLAHVSNRVWKEVVDHIPESDKSPELYLAVRQTVENELREHVVGMDMCGMADVCMMSKEYDPWPARQGQPLGLVIH